MSRPVAGRAVERVPTPRELIWGIEDATSKAISRIVGAVQMESRDGRDERMGGAIESLITTLTEMQIRILQQSRQAAVSAILDRTPPYRPGSVEDETAKAMASFAGIEVSRPGAARVGDGRAEAARVGDDRAEADHAGDGRAEADHAGDGRAEASAMNLAREAGLRESYRDYLDVMNVRGEARTEASRVPFSSAEDPHPEAARYKAICAEAAKYEAIRAEAERYESIRVDAERCSGFVPLLDELASRGEVRGLVDFIDA